MVCSFESSSISTIAYLLLVPSLPEKQPYINKASRNDVGFFSCDRPTFSQKFFTKDSAFNSQIFLKKLFQSSRPEALTKMWVDFDWLNPVNLQVASVISWFFEARKRSWLETCGEMTFLFPSHWKETLKTFSNPEPEVCSKMHLSSCKVQQSQSTESKKKKKIFLCFLHLFTISLSPVFFSVLKDGGKTGRKKTCSICWLYPKWFLKPHQHTGGRRLLSCLADVNVLVRVRSDTGRSSQRPESTSPGSPFRAQLGRF